MVMKHRIVSSTSESSSDSLDFRSSHVTYIAFFFILSDFVFQKRSIFHNVAWYLAFIAFYNVSRFIIRNFCHIHFILSDKRRLHFRERSVIFSLLTSSSSSLEFIRSLGHEGIDELC